MKIVLGTMEFGRRLGVSDSLSLINIFNDHGYKEIDTASMYANGETEIYLGKFKKHTDNYGSKISTKVNPDWKENGFRSSELCEQFETSLKRMDQSSVDILYLHWPSKKDSLEETLSTINDLYRQEKFERFGLSNYSSWQVMKIYNLCEKNSWVKPSVYQGMYNMLTRSVEKELIQCVRDLKISFYAYNPLAGGILTGRYKHDDLGQFNDQTIQNRFHSTGGNWAKAYQDRFWNKQYFKALSHIDKILNDELKLPSSIVHNDPSFSTPNLNLTSLSFSWLKNHSKLDSEYGDAIVVGASSISQFKMNMELLSNNMNISDQLLQNIKHIYEENVGGVCPNYFR